MPVDAAILGNSRLNGSVLLAAGAVVCLAVAVALQVHVAVGTAYVWDEDREWIPAALAISLDPESLNLPLRTERHGALAAYFIRLGGEIAGHSHLGFRWINIVFSVVAALYVGRLARYVTGSPAASVAAIAVFALNECAIMTFSTAFQIGPYLAFSAAALYHVLRFLDSERTAHAVLAGSFLGLAAEVYEIGILTVAACGLYALFAKGRRLFRLPGIYAGMALVAVLLLPDLHANYIAPEARAMDHASYLDRIGRIGFTPKYLGFYLYGAMEWAYPVFLGRPYVVDGARGLGYMNVVLGGALLLAVGLSALRLLRVRAGEDTRHRMFLLWVFGFVFGVFSVIETGGVTVAGVGSGVPIYVSLTVIPAAVLFGAAVGRGGVPGMVFVALLVVGASASVGRIALSGGSEFLRREAKAVAVPENLPPPDGAMYAVGVAFDLCDRCPAAFEPVLTNFRIEESDGTRIALAEAGNAVEGVETGTADLEFGVRNTFAVAPTGFWGARAYVAEYALRAEGRTFATATAVVRVPVREGDPGFRPDWPVPFWVERPD